MDALIYTVMSGAERALKAQQVHANNLANLDTPGFRADMELARSQPVPGYGYDARHTAQAETSTVATRPGTVRATGRDLDVAITGPGFLTVQWGEGEAYTRAGALSIDAQGALTVNGHAVMGDGGPIVLPEYTRMAIDADGTIRIQTPESPEMQPVDRLKLVKPEAADLTKNEAGLITTRDGQTLPMDETVVVQGGHIEGSNVSAVEEMVAVMSLNRDFEIQMKLYKAADDMAQSGNRLIRE